MNVYIKSLKVYLIIIIFLFQYICLSAQDIIILRNGDEIQSKVTRVTSGEIEYKKWTNQDGPYYTISKSDVFMIKYINGEKDIFTNNDTQSEEQKHHESSTNTTQRYVKKEPAENNQQLIDKYKTPVHFTKTPTTKKPGWCFPILAISDSSIISNPDIEISIEPDRIDDLFHYFYKITIKNKTDKIIYVDMANSFRIYKSGKSRSYFNPEQTTFTQSHSSGAAVNLGGITNALGIGGIVGTLANAVTAGRSNQNSISTTYINQQILSIPPYSSKALTEYKEVDNITISQTEMFACLYELNWEDYRGLEELLKKELKKYDYIKYSEETSPYTTKYIITYSTVPDFSEYSSLNIKLYARYMYGCYLSGNLKKVRKIIPNFWIDPALIIGNEICL